MTLEEIAALHSVPLAMTNRDVIARRRSRRSNLGDRRAELAMTLEEIATLRFRSVRNDIRRDCRAALRSARNDEQGCHCEEA
jgi:hypothetical protein